MTHRYGRISVDEQHGRRHADDIAAAQYDRLCALELSSRLLQQRHGAGRSAGDEQRLPSLHGETPDIHGMKAVDIFYQRYGSQYGLRIYMIGQRQLNENTVHFGIRGESVHEIFDFLLTRTGGKLVTKGFDSHLFAPVAFHPHVLCRSRIFSHEYRRQSRAESVLALHFRRCRCNLLPNAAGDGFSVYDLGGHGIILLS
jgi:hypothetical protein